MTPRSFGAFPIRCATPLSVVQRGTVVQSRSHGIMANRLIGVTRKDHMRESPEFDGKYWPVHNERGQQIKDFMAGNGHLNPLGIEHYSPEAKLGPIEAYAVIDDLDLGISAAGHPFVQTNGQVGMQIDDARRLVKLLTKV